MIRATVFCDSCKVDKTYDGEPVDWEGWATVSFNNGNGFHYCPECWSKMFMSLIKESPCEP